jgi:hypothetical protein
VPVLTRPNGRHDCDARPGRESGLCRYGKTLGTELLASDGLPIFDDYYLNDESRGAKSLIDDLLHDDLFVVRFFPMTEDIQVTMVAVTRQGA